MMPGRGFIVALSFLTRIPIRHNHEPNVSSAAPWFPAVGVVVGAASGLVAFAMSSASTPFVGAVCGVVTAIVITGAFHEDGLADVADAFVGGWTIDDRLRILKDPRHGTYGVVAIGCSIALRIAALESMSGRDMFLSLIVAHCLARGGAVFVMLLGSLARQDGLGADYVKNLPRKGSIASIALLSIGSAVILREWALVILPITITGALLIRAWSRRKIGGISGDVLGTVEQVCEVLILLALAAR